MPVSATPEHGALYLVVFADAARDRPTTGDAADAGTRHLEDDLRTTRVDLQRTVDELESANRELSLSQEDQSAVNEELQSINEELESSKEELQSLNEELQTVNQQLQSKVTELETAHNDLVNLLTSSDIVTLCLDPAMCIRWHSPATQRLVNIRPGDIGRRIDDFASDLLGPRLVDSARIVMATLTPVQEEVVTGRDEWFLRRVLPYRTGAGAMQGVIITFADITDTKRATAKALAERQILLGSLEERVKIRTGQLRSMAVALSVAEERERRSVASDLHDDLGQTLALIRVKLEMLVKHSAGSALESGTKEITALIESADERVRSLVFQLSPPVLHELGLRAGLAWLCDEMQRVYGLKVELEDQGCPTVSDPVVRTIVFRAVRELLINVVRHAEVSESRILCVEADRGLRITVSDGGGGFDVASILANATGSGHFGLVSVRERLEFIGGRLDIRSVPHGGTEATLSLPIADQTL
jgi:two-component system CheB/CheR fusion protein